MQKNSLIPLFLIAVAAGCDGPILPDPAVRFFAFGDSATAGATTPAYPELLRQQLGEPVGSITNLGDDGETSGEGLERLRGLLSGGFFPNAHSMLYWEGGNDITEFVRNHDPLFVLCPDDADFPFADALDETLTTTQANIEAAIQAGRQAGLTVYVATYFLLPEAVIACDALLINVLLPAQADWANAYVAMLNDRIRRAAANQGAILVDVASERIQADPANFFDCNHLDRGGNDIVAAAFADAILAAGVGREAGLPLPGITMVGR